MVLVRYALDKVDRVDQVEPLNGICNDIRNFIVCVEDCELQILYMLLKLFNEFINIKNKQWKSDKIMILLDICHDENIMKE